MLMYTLYKEKMASATRWIDTYLMPKPVVTERICCGDRLVELGVLIRIPCTTKGEWLLVSILILPLMAMAVTVVVADGRSP